MNPGGFHVVSRSGESRRGDLLGGGFHGTHSCVFWMETVAPMRPLPEPSGLLAGQNDDNYELPSRRVSPVGVVAMSLVLQARDLFSR